MDKIMTLSYHEELLTKQKKNYLLFYSLFWQLDFITAMALGVILVMMENFVIGLVQKVATFYQQSTYNVPKILKQHTRHFDSNSGQGSCGLSFT